MHSNDMFTTFRHRKKSFCTNSTARRICGSYSRACSRGISKASCWAARADATAPHILEIGTFTGYSALCMAAGLEEDGVLDTVEVDDELEEFAASFFRRSPHGQKIRQHIGSALDIVPTLGYTFDLVFIDGDKREYPDYYRMLMGDGGSKVLVHSGSILIADNILWSGKIVEPVAHNDRHTQALLEFNRMIREDERVENVIVPIRDGLNLIRVK